MRQISHKILKIWLVFLPIIIPSSTILAQFWEDPMWLVKDIEVIGTDKWPSSSLLDTISSTIRWILGILATIALCICLYAGFKMLTSWGDSKGYDAWLTILKNAAIWLAIIWLSWIIVSAIFWFIELQWWAWTMT